MRTFVHDRNLRHKNKKHTHDLNIIIGNCGTAGREITVCGSRRGEGGADNGMSGKYVEVKNEKQNKKYKYLCEGKCVTRGGTTGEPSELA